MARMPYVLSPGLLLVVLVLLLPASGQLGVGGGLGQLGGGGGLGPLEGLLSPGASSLGGFAAPDAPLQGSPAGGWPLSGASLGGTGGLGAAPPSSPLGAPPLGRLGDGAALGAAATGPRAAGQDRFGAGAPLGSAAVGSRAAAAETLHRAFHYADIAAHLLERPADRTVEVCRELCLANATCAAWEVCAPLGDGCEGCYLVGRAPRSFAERPGWHAEVLPGREDLGWDQPTFAGNLTAAECHEFLLSANGADQNQAFHEPANMQRYAACGFLLRDTEAPRQLFVPGQHWPTFLVANFWDPPVALPGEVESEMFAASGRPRRARSDPASAGPGVTAQLHATVGTTAWEDHLREKPRGPHAFVLPFYDTNIGHWVKQHGSMNPLQSYEMQSLLREGHTVVDVGANLGCYTVPFAERVGPRGKVLAFEPFRWLQQIVSANVAINGLSNVWVLPLGLGAEAARAELRPPQLRFFSSPGGVKLQDQQGGLKPEEAMQLYDWDSPPELITVVSLDELLISRPASTALVGIPPVEDVRLIKIDVEGMEKEVIAGARQTIQAFKPIIWTENVAYFSSNGQDTSFLQLLDELGYACAQAQNAPNDVVCTDQQGRGHQINN